jgi:hypothetical protein
MAWKDKYVIVCPDCYGITLYTNKLEWILHNPFHWFGKRRNKCLHCGKKFYSKITKIKKVGRWE